MPVIVVEQALYGNPEPGGFRFLARSPGFVDEWLALAEQLCAGFGERPAGVACPAAVFAQPLGPKRVAVVQVADLGTDDAGRPGAIGFRLLVIGQADYADLGGDPFALADQFPPDWNQRDTLPTLEKAAELPARRTAAQIVAVIKGPHSATLLGGTQALIDGGRLVFERPGPAPDLLRQLWLLLPTSTRAELWPATFAFSNALSFHALVVPRADFSEYARYLREEQAGDYPEGRYELGLQAAAESGDERELDRMFARRSSTQTLRLAVYILAVTVVVAVVSNVLNPPPPRGFIASLQTRPTTEAAPTTLDLADFNAPVPEALRPRLVEALRELGRAAGVADLPDAATAGELLTTLRPRLEEGSDPRRLAIVEEQRSNGKLARPEQQLRAWLWLRGDPRFDDRALNAVELTDLLQKQVR